MKIRKAKTEDIKALQNLYFSVYGNSYPLSLGQDAEVMRNLLAHKENLWFVMQGPDSQLVASCVFEVDTDFGISRVSGLVVHPQFQGHHLGQEILHAGMQEIFENPELRTAYATTRTLSMPAQMAFLNEGFLPVGISPNAHKLETFETLTLMAAFNKKATFKRNAEISLPAELKSLVEITQKNIPSWQYDSIRYLAREESGKKKLNPIGFEVIFAPHFVYERFHKKFQDPWEKFYPFHKPNMMIVSEDQEIEIYAYFSPKDGYCTIITYSSEMDLLEGRLKKLFSQLKDYGITYIEVLTQLDDYTALDGLLRARFLPCGLYPAMLKIGENEKDVVLMSRSMEPLDFHYIHLAPCFQPFLSQYTRLWKTEFLDSLLTSEGAYETVP